MVIVKTRARPPKKLSKMTWYTTHNRHVYFEPNFLRYSQKAAEIIVNSLRVTLQKKETAVFVPSSGKSPKIVYQILCREYKNAIDWSRVVVVQMDEYCGIPCNDVKSMSANIERDLVHPLGVKKYIHYFNIHGKFIQSLEAYEQLIEKLGGIDLVVHGIGQNGHIGFNEPDSDWTSPTRKITLTDSTLKANFNETNSHFRESYRQGVTIGLHILTKAKHSILLISGKSKNEIVEKLFSQTPSKAIPASSLSLNFLVDCIVDGDSISLSGKIKS